MARKRADSFKIALDTLREELRTGAHPAGARLTANEIAERLSLSQTPVREALSRLAGEGLLLDRRGQGFFVQSLTEHDIVALYRLQMELLLISCDRERAQISDIDLDRFILGDLVDAEPRKFVLASERLFRVFAAGSSPPLARHLARLHDQLAPIRLAEPRVLDRLPEEFADLVDAVRGADPGALPRKLQGFFARRIEAAPALIRIQGASETIESI